MLETDVTDTEGEYSLLRRPLGDQRLYIRFGAIQDVLSGHLHVCAAAVSREVMLPVTG